MERDIRWIQRFDNYKKACNRLLQVSNSNIFFADLNELEREGLIQRFEYTYELAWKTLQDYLRYLGFEFQAGPNTTLQLAFESGLITDHDTWRSMGKARNIASHTYDEDDAAAIAHEVFHVYAKVLADLRDFLLEKEKDTLEKDTF